jgi:hypothetical protein
LALLRAASFFGPSLGATQNGRDLSHPARQAAR